MATLSLNKAEKVARKTKKTIKKDLENGNLSGSKNDRGHWEIEESELARFYDLNTSNLVSTPSQTPRDTTTDTAENLIKIARLEAELDAAKQLQAKAEESADYLQRKLDEADQDRRNADARLEDLRVKLDASNQNTAMKAENKPRGVLARLFG